MLLCSLPVWFDALQMAGDVLVTKLELNISAKNLEDRDATSKSDPMCVVYLKVSHCVRRRETHGDVLRRSRESVNRGVSQRFAAHSDTLVTLTDAHNRDLLAPSQRVGKLMEGVRSAIEPEKC